MAFVWIAVLVLAVLLEALTSELVSIWFFPAALVAMVLALCRVPVWIQLPVFLAVGILLLLCTRPLCRRWLQGRSSRTNTDLLIGRECPVTEQICNREETGEVKLGGLRWSARAEDPARIIPEGETVHVVAIEGVKLIVK